MPLLDSVLTASNVARVSDLDRLERKEIIKGDFEGSVTGNWVELAQNGAGIVAYNGKQYTTKPLGFTSIEAGHAVELSYARGVYYSKW